MAIPPCVADEKCPFFHDGCKQHFIPLQSSYIKFVSTVKAVVLVSFFAVLSLPSTKTHCKFNTWITLIFIFPQIKPQPTIVMQHRIKCNFCHKLQQHLESCISCQGRLLVEMKTESGPPVTKPVVSLSPAHACLTWGREGGGGGGGANCDSVWSLKPGAWVGC